MTTSLRADPTVGKEGSDWSEPRHLKVHLRGARALNLSPLQSTDPTPVQTSFYASRLSPSHNVHQSIGLI